jgi:hypothetical protein
MREERTRELVGGFFGSCVSRRCLCETMFKNFLTLIGERLPKQSKHAAREFAAPSQVVLPSPK